MSGRLRPVSAKRRKRDASYPAARRAVWERSGGLCEAPVHADDCPGQMHDTHHIAGRLGPDPHRLDNLIGLSDPCHREAHRRPLWAREQGLSASRLGGAA